MKNITAKELKKLFEDKNKDFQVIDVRSQLEWNDSHIEDPRVINIETNSLLLNTSKIDKNKDIYVICESGGRSSFAQMVLKAKGVETINVLGGMGEFRKIK